MQSVVSPIGTIVKQTWTNPAASTVTYVHAAITLPAAGTTEVTTAITNPDYPRIISITGNAAGISGNVVIVGTNYNDGALTDTIVASGSSTIYGKKAFKTVTSITVPTRNAGGDTIAIGIYDALGLSRLIGDGSALIAAYLTGQDFLSNGDTYHLPNGDAGAYRFSATDISRNLVLPQDVPDGARDYEVVMFIGT